MNPTHLHLMVTHLPIYGSILGSLILLYGILTGSRHTKLAAYYVLVISAVGGIIAFSTGESAEETIENLQGITKNLIEQHEEFAELTLFAIIAMGTLSLAAIYFTLRRPAYTKGMSLIVLAISVVCFAMSAWTGYLGGQIRHTELSSANRLWYESDTTAQGFYHINNCNNIHQEF